VRRAGEKLVKDVLGEGMNPEDVSRLLDRAAGNVFYLEELIRAFAEGPTRHSMRPPGSGATSIFPPPAPSTGRLPDDREESSPRGEVAWALPPTVLAMVQARLERVDPMARRLLRAASIFGEVFWRGGLMALTGGAHAAGEIDEWLLELSKRELIQRRDVSRFPVEREYQFRHALVRDAAYEMLTAEDRALGHKLAAEWLETAGEHEAMLLAEHFERGAALVRAASFYARAAAQALEGNDFVAARARAERALQAGVSGAELARLQLLLAEASRWGGDHEDARRHAEAAMRGFGAGHGWFGAASEAVAAGVVLGRFDAVVTLAVDVRERLAGDAGALDAERVIATSRIAVRILSTGLFDVADALIARVERDGRAVVENDPAARAAMLAARVARAKWNGDIAEAAKLAQEAVACFELVGDVRNAVDQRNISGFCLVQLGAFHEAETVLREATAAAERLGLPVVVNETKLHLAQLYARMQRKKEAIAAIEEVIAAFAAQGDLAGEGRARAYLVGAFHLAEEFAVATQEAIKALPLLEHSPPYRASLLGLVAISRADKGDAQGAFEAGSEAMRILERLGGTVEGESIARLGHAEGLYAIGDVEGARVAIAVARDRLVARANRIEDPAWRKHFMNRMHEHRRILARAGEWLA
jgi:tetratricopeptide (TPR) repeat protein